MKPLLAGALLVGYVVLAIALDVLAPALLSPYGAAFLLRDPLVDAALVVGLGIGGVMAFRMEREQRALGLLVGFCFSGGVVFLGLQFVVPGALGNFVLDALCVLLASPGIAFATAAPVILARRAIAA